MLLPLILQLQLLLILPLIYPLILLMFPILSLLLQLILLLVLPIIMLLILPVFVVLPAIQPPITSADIATNTATSSTDGIADADTCTDDDIFIENHFRENQLLFQQLRDQYEGIHGKFALKNITTMRTIDITCKKGVEDKFQLARHIAHAEDDAFDKISLCYQQVKCDTDL
ncbi:hypothetical protein DPMN_040806 [Dreissena polymorpha]|uniref:Uncharacterized protein n=1 Tax=Dreissena polymorpha TaxID=45954 RepID=A0A9D4CXL7_DREPO|nr:hypothetical protein DPMN_040806 [Dreissena polymorpha]